MRIGGRDVRQDADVRIGTWNLAGRWSDDHRALMLGVRLSDHDCYVVDVDL